MNLTPVFATEEEKQRYYQLRNQFAAAALTASVYIFKDYGRDHHENVRAIIIKQCFAYADDMLVISGEFKFVDNG